MLILIKVNKIVNVCYIFCFLARGGVLKSIGDMGAVMTNMVLGTAGMTKQVAATMQKKASITGAEDTLVMDTKLKIIEILQVILIYLFFFVLLFTAT